MEPTNKVDLMAKPLIWTKEELNNSPSIKDGMPENEEKMERYLACEIVRSLVREVFKNKKDADATAVQMLGCYYLQLFFMFQSMKNFDPKHAVALAAARLACKMYDEKPRGQTMYNELERQRCQRGLDGLTEEAKKELKEQASEIEIYMLRLTKFETDIALPSDDMEQHVDKALKTLSTSCTSFRNTCGNKDPGLEATNLKKVVCDYSGKFLADSFQGLLPLRFSRRCATWSAILFALRFAQRKIPMPELLQTITESSTDDGIAQSEIEGGFQEMLAVFRAKSKADKQKGTAQAAPAAPPASTAPALRERSRSRGRNN